MSKIMDYAEEVYGEEYPDVNEENENELWDRL